MKRNPVITFERPKLIYSLLAPPYLSAEQSVLELREPTTRPDKCQDDQFSFILKINRLKFEVRNTEDLRCSIAIYDMKEKLKVTESFKFRVSELEKGSVNAVFKLQQCRDEYVIFFCLEKTLQGDKYDAIEAYQSETTPERLAAVRDYMKTNETVLAKYQMQFLWTFVAFAGLKGKKFSRNNNSTSGREEEINDSSPRISSNSKEGSLHIVDNSNDCEDGTFVPKKGQMDFCINHLFRFDNEKLTDEKICTQIVEVCRNAKAFEKRSINCDFSISIGGTGDLYNIKSDDNYKVKPWFDEGPTRGKLVREFPTRR